MADYTATYSPEDNKLRLTCAYRLDEDMYKEVKELGFIWAPKQEIFVKPSWSPEAEDYLINLCGTIGDEDSSLVERAEIRSERFEGYSVKRADDARQAQDTVNHLTDGIPMGQPILIGHHSEKRARSDQKKIENSMNKSIQMWKTSKYWTYRAAGAIRSAKYKERPDVRARRIKKLEAEKRKRTKNKEESEKINDMWTNPVKYFKDKDNIELTRGRALVITNYFDNNHYIGVASLWSRLDKDEITPEQAKELSKPKHDRLIEHENRYITHLTNRLVYEKAMLEDQGASDLLKPKARPKQPPLCNYKAPEGIRIENQYHRGEFSVYPQIEMTKAQWAKIYTDYKGTRLIENSHRVRISMATGENYSRQLSCVFITDSKVHKKPSPIEPEPVTPRIRPTYTRPEKTEAQKNIEALQNTKIETVTAPQLFPTPPEIAEDMVAQATISYGMSVLEPSAGTGNIIDAIVKNCGTQLTSVEISYELCEKLKAGLSGKVINKDFFDCNGDIGTFDRIVMNPPFKDGADIKHINHAFGMLKPGGRLVAICANGPRQQRTFKSKATLWKDLPEGSFKNQGTNVNTAMIILDK